MSIPKIKVEKEEKMEEQLNELFDSLIIDPQSGAIAIKTAEFEHTEMDTIRIIIPEHLEQ